MRLADMSWDCQHIQQEHPELWCGMCGMGFASAGQLLEHYLEAESAVHPTCKMCGEGFQNQSVLDEVSSHDATCTEARP